MSRFWIGLAVGVLVGAIGALWLRPAAHELQAPQRGLAAEAAAMPTTAPASTSVNPFATATASSARPAAPNAPSTANAAKPAAANAASSESASTEPIAGASTAASENPPHLSPAHAHLLDSQREHDTSPNGVSALHEKFSAQQRDDGWSYYAEQNLTAYLGPATADQGLELAGVSCRQTLCEIQGFGDVEHGGRRWSTLMDGIYDQPWGRDFGGISSQSQTNQGRMVILTILQRAGAR